MPSGPYRAKTCRERIDYGSHIHSYFLTTQGHGGPPWISDQLNSRATSETTRTHRERHHSHPHSYLNKANMMKMIMMAR
ncbi:hypothetical protein C0J52_14777 [Blattella germanica]|nr:hypothetical protein C0J52_14777 [Blattella germanica]